MTTADEWRQIVVHAEKVLDTVSNLPTSKVRDGVYVLRAELANMRALAECEPNVSHVDLPAWVDEPFRIKKLPDAGRNGV